MSGEGGGGGQKLQEGQPFLYWKVMEQPILEIIPKHTKVERIRTDQPGEEKVQGDLVNVCNTWWEEMNKKELDSFQWCSVKRQLAMGTNWNTEKFT